MSNIDSRQKVAERLWDWEFLNPAFPGGIRPMDLDGIVEINGSFLVLEAKPTGKSIPKGQRIALDQLASQESFHVLILYGEPSDPEKMRLLGHHRKPVDCDKREVIRLVKRWSKKVS